MKAIPVNLASNPFEHRQWSRRVKRVAVAVAFLLTAVHLLIGWSLLGEPPAVVADRDTIQPLRAWSDEVEATVAAADPRDSRQLAVSAGLANALIEQRAFPWGRMFSALEEVMPDDVRLEIIQPVATVDGVRVTLTAASGSADSLRSFLSALEERAEFRTVYPGRQSVGPDGALRLSIEAVARAGSPSEEGMRP